MSIMVWANTRTLHPLIPELEQSVPPDQAEVAVVGASQFDVSSMPKLKAVFRCGVGTDNIDFAACKENGIRVELPSAHSASIIYEETANFAVKSILDGLYRWSGDVDQWSKADRLSLAKRKVLLLGQGNIGKRVKKKLTGLTAVQTWDPAYDSFDTLHELLESAEVVSLHMPLDASTRGWFDATLLGAMSDGACLVNTARGAIVDESALLREISSGRLRAIFDVFWEEPYSGALREFHPDRFVMSPHIASHCHEFVESLAEDFRTLIRSMGVEVPLKVGPTGDRETERKK